MLNMSSLLKALGKGGGGYFCAQANGCLCLV